MTRIQSPGIACVLAALCCPPTLTAQEPFVTSLENHLFTGYQGWFLAKGDDIDAGFVHWGPVDRDPPRCTVDMWPDLTEFGEDERFPTAYRHEDGRVAEVFSSAHPGTVDRHFAWMNEYGIDGAFVQRFDSTLRPDDPEHWLDRRAMKVLANCRAGAEAHERAFAVMYDCHFDVSACERIRQDWTRLVKTQRLLDSRSYLHHRGAPLVALWGFGFDHRRFDAEATRELFAFLRSEEFGGCRIMLGVPNDWASWTDERIALLREHATVISPWNVGRYRDGASATRHFERHWPKDLGWCEERDKDYLPVVFPGFSWTNLKRGGTKERPAPLDQIPRRGGRFFWHQFEEIRRFGMKTAYVAMFDEVDEGTAVFKVTNDPPVGRFVTYEGLPSDHYLRLCGLGVRLLRGEDISFPRSGK